MINIDIYTKNIGSKLDSPVLQYNKLPKTTLTKYQRRYIKEKEKFMRKRKNNYKNIRTKNNSLSITNINIDFINEKQMIEKNKSREFNLEVYDKKVNEDIEQYIENENEEMSFDNNPEIQLKKHIENIEKLDIEREQQINEIIQQQLKIEIIQQQLKIKEKEESIPFVSYEYDAENYHRKVVSKHYEELLQEEFNKYVKPKIEAQLEEIKRRENKQKLQEYYDKIEEKLQKEIERKKHLILKVYTAIRMQNSIVPLGKVNDYYITGDLNGWEISDLIDAANKIMYKH